MATATGDTRAEGGHMNGHGVGELSWFGLLGGHVEGLLLS